MRANKHAARIEPRVTDVVGGCRRANMGKDRFYQLLHSGEIESYLDGRSRKILIASIDAYIDRQIAESKGSFQRARFPNRAAS
jgi:excisionase family DNA binding protein